MQKLIINDVADVFITNNETGEIKALGEAQAIPLNDSKEMPRQLLNSMLTDFSYRTVVKIVEYKSNEKLFKGTVSHYYQSELKGKELYIEVAEVFDGEFVIKVI